MKRLFLLVLLVIGLVVPCLAFADIMDVVADTAWNLSGGALLFGSLGDAPPFLETLTFFDRCWFCEPIDIVFDVINQVVTETCSTMQPVSLAFLGALFLFWLLVRVGKGVVDVTPSEDSRLVYDLLKQTMRVIVATTLLVGWGTVFSHIVDPALEVAIGMGNTISLNRMSGEQSIGFRSSPGSSSSTATATLCPEYDNLLKQAKNSSSFGQQNDSETNPQEGGQAYSPVVKEAFICYIRVGCASFNRGLALGASAIQAWSHQNIISKVRYFELFLIGLFIFVGYLLLLLGLPTKLLDPLITLAFVSALLPVWIVLWTFEQTKKYATNALNLFIGVLVHLIVISIVTVLVIEIMNCALGDKDTQRELFQRLLNGEDTYEVFTTTLGLGYYSFVLLVALMWLSGKLFDKTTTLAGQFEKVVDFGIGSGAAQNISAVVSKVKGAGAEGIAAVGHGTTLGAQKVKSWASRHFNSNNNSGDGSGSGGGGEGGGNPAPSSGNPPIW